MHIDINDWWRHQTIIYHCIKLRQPSSNRVKSNIRVYQLLLKCVWGEDFSGVGFTGLWRRLYFPNNTPDHIYYVVKWGVRIVKYRLADTYHWFRQWRFWFSTDKIHMNQIWVRYAIWEIIYHTGATNLRPFVSFMMLSWLLHLFRRGARLLAYYIRLTSSPRGNRW